MVPTKFHLFPIGEAFRYEGRVFTKNAPLTATDEEGRQRMIPRSALVEPLQEESSEPPTEPKAELQAMADDYQRECLRIIREVVASVDPAAAETAEASLASARRNFDERLEQITGSR